MIQDEKFNTRVIFKKSYNPYIKEWEVFACLLDVEANKGRVMTYQHVGQHSEGDILYCAGCKPATPKEYEGLKIELESIGYNLIIRRKFTRGA